LFRVIFTRETCGKITKLEKFKTFQIFASSRIASNTPVPKFGSFIRQVKIANETYPV
jgi:hypothetical protein